MARSGDCLRPLKPYELADRPRFTLVTVYLHAGGLSMESGPVVRVSHLLDERGISGFHIQLIFWSALIALFDGYDIAAISLAAPHLVRDWHIERSALGPVLSASLVGILFGSMIFGWIGDRFGRKKALLGSLFLFGIFTWIAAHATNLTQMSALRFVAGPRRG